jgi:hypothetical protein
MTQGIGLGEFRVSGECAARWIRAAALFGGVEKAGAARVTHAYVLDSGALQIVCVLNDQREVELLADPEEWWRVENN